ncbi:hypothetical protein LTR22_008365 [Elasticomyces elasticus]|nr:hypothetical protein LTR22_008365 [Elasticomyces elasticus]
MLPPGLKSPREVNLYYDEVYFSLIKSGQAHPFIYPWATGGAAIVLLYLLIDHRKSPVLRWLRFPVFAFLVAYQGWCIATNRARSPAAAFGVGLISSWGTLWVAAIMIANDCQTDFRRIERRSSNDKVGPNGTVTNGSVRNQLTNQTTKSASDPVTPTTNDISPKHEQLLYWQSYPSSSFLSRMDWVADVFCSFRGVGWNWQTSGIPPPPKWVEDQLRQHEEAGGDKPSSMAVTTSRSGVRRFANRAELIRNTAINITIGYIALDIIVTLMHKDPYFWGYVESKAPAHLPHVIQDSDFLTHVYRLLLSLAGIYAAPQPFSSSGQPSFAASWDRDGLVFVAKLG